MNTIINYLIKKRNDNLEKNGNKENKKKVHSLESYNSVHSCNSIYNVTTPKNLIIEDIKLRLPISPQMMLYISTNLSDEEKFELINEFNKVNKV